MLELGSLDLEEIATALGDQATYGHHWLFNPDNGQVVYWTADGGIDGQTPIDLDELDLLSIRPLPSYIWYQDMVEFTDRISDERMRDRLYRALDGKGAFRRFKDALRETYPHLLPVWYDFRDLRAKRRAVDWLVDNSLVDDDTAVRFISDYPDPDIP
jgi:hypothetical protein